MSAYREIEPGRAPAARRVSVVGRRGPNYFVGIIIVAIGVAAYFGIFRGIDVECWRGPSDDRCDVDGHVFPIRDISGLELLERDSVDNEGEHTNVRRLVLHTSTGVVDIEKSWTMVAGDTRPSLVNRFNEFLTSKSPRFSGRPHGFLRDLAVAIVVLCVATLIARRWSWKGVRIEVDPIASTATITDLSRRGSTELITLDPPPIVSLQDIGGMLMVCVAQPGRRLPIIQCPADTTTRSLLVKQVESALQTTPGTT